MEVEVDLVCKLDIFTTFDDFDNNNSQIKYNSKQKWKN